MRVVGVDGAKGGWVAIVLDDGCVSTDHVLRPVETRVEELGDAEVIAIDVPIGFGPRRADAAARAFLSTISRAIDCGVKNSPPRRPSFAANSAKYS